MLFLTLVGGLLLKTGRFLLLRSAWSPAWSAFFLFFAVMAAVVIPYVIKRLDKMKSDEMFVLFMLADHRHDGRDRRVLRRAFPDRRLLHRHNLRRDPRHETSGEEDSPARDAFVAIFFVSFGMFIDPSMFGSVWSIIIIAVAIIILDEIDYHVHHRLPGRFPQKGGGFHRRIVQRQGRRIGHVRHRWQQGGQATKGAELYPIAGAVTFVMSVLCPFFIKKSYDIADRMAIKNA